MPFDGDDFILSAEETLASALAAGGRAPVDRDLLMRHQGEEVRRHPAGWGYRHRGAIEAGQAAALLAAIVGFLAFFAADRVACASAVGLVGLALGLSPVLVPSRGPARWREREIADLSEVPALIRALALDLQRRLPAVSFRIGELYQDRIRLDPYLVAEYGPARLVLGIWDGDRLVACAGPIARAA